MGRRALEGALLFIVLPVLLAVPAWRNPGGAPVIPTLLAVGAVLVVTLARDPSFSWRAELRRGADASAWRFMLLRWALGATALTSTAHLALPELFLDLPRHHLGLWLAVMLVYPLLSVLPQEVMYRTFFLHRYGELLGRRAGFASAAAFALAHLLFWNWIAILLTWVGGALFTHTYRRTGSLRLAVVEHTLYGQVIFTVGLGRYFYGGTVETLTMAVP